jgi:aspartate kinase
LIVMKFGGSSLADAERILAAANTIALHAERRPVVVVSALGGVTDLLVRSIDAARRGERDALERQLAELQRKHRWALAGAVEDAGDRHQLGLEIDELFEDLRQRLRSIRILGEATERASDAVLACGEDLSARIVTAALRGLGQAARWVDPRRLVPTDAAHGEARVDENALRRRCAAELLPVLEDGGVPVTGGFVGAAANGDTTTLGRGGSDTTAALLGSALRAEEIQIWTDVDGVMSADPRLVPAARTLPRVSFSEAAELAYYGAKVLHPDSIAPAVRRGIPVRVLNALRPDSAGTVVVGDDVADQPLPLASVANRAGVCLVRVISRRMRVDAAFLPGVLDALRELEIVPDLVVSMGVAVTLVLPRSVRRESLEGRLGDGVRIEVVPDQALVCVVGSGLARDAGFRTTVLTALAELRPDVITPGASRTSLAAVLPRAKLEAAVGDLHRRFFEVRRT